jgi:hypothetical protein
MEKDLAMLIAGALIGFIISMITIKYQEYNERKRATKICKIELFKISKLITPFVNQNNGISTDEIPNFKMTTQIDIFLSLKDIFRTAVYDITTDLDSAENNRKHASSLLDQPKRIKELNLYGMLYLDYLKSAQTKIDELKNKFK